MVEQDVALVHGREQVGAVEESGRLQRCITQFGVAGQVAELHEHAQVERAVHRVDVVLFDLDLLAQQGDELR